MTPSGRYLLTLLEGETLTRIAERLYGDASLWTLLAETNKISDPAKLPIGRYLEVPIRDFAGRYWYHGSSGEWENELDGCWGVPGLAVAIDLDHQGGDEFLYLDPFWTKYQWDEGTGEEIHHTVDLVVAADLEGSQTLRRFRLLETESDGCLLSLLAYRAGERHTLVFIELWTEERTAKANGWSDLHILAISDQLELVNEAILTSVSAIAAASGSSVRTELDSFSVDEGKLIVRVTETRSVVELGPRDTRWSQQTENRYRLSYDPISRSWGCIGIRCTPPGQNVLGQARQQQEEPR